MRDCNQANPAASSTSATPRSHPRRRHGLPLPPGEGRGRQRRPGQQLHPGHPTAALRRRRPRPRSVLAGDAQPVLRRPGHGACTAVRQAPRRAAERAERQRRLQHDDQLPHRPERRGSARHPHRRCGRAGPPRRPGLQRHLLRDQPLSPWYGEPRPIAGIPIGIYARVDTVPNVNQPYDPNTWRLLTTVTTSPDGTFEALVPSTETWNCPIPQGPCPGMYLVTVDDPGTAAHPNANYNPNLLLATTPSEVWPGLTTQLDLPLDPISGTACEDPAARPVPPGPTCCRSRGPTCSRRTAAPPAGSPSSATSSARRGRQRTPPASGHAHRRSQRPGRDAHPGQRRHRELDTGNRLDAGHDRHPGPGGGDQRRANLLPNLTFRPGPKQLTITSANANGGVSSVNGITVHVLGRTARAPT